MILRNSDSANEVDHCVFHDTVKNHGIDLEFIWEDIKSYRSQGETPSDSFSPQSAVKYV
jgi:hypothetical protein